MFKSSYHKRVRNRRRKEQRNPWTCLLQRSIAQSPWSWVQTRSNALSTGFHVIVS